MDSYDIAIIGAGSAGLSGALRAEALGARVALIERGPLGGTCPNRGCLPTKHLVSAAERYYYGQAEAFRGVEPLGALLDFGDLMAEREEVVRAAQDEKRALLREHPGIALLTGSSRLESGQRVRINDRVIDAGAVALAPGSSPRLPDIPGLAQAAPLTSDDIHRIKRLPERLAVIGGGEIGVEYAQFFRHLGVEVTLLEREARILPREEPEVAEALTRYLQQEGVSIHTGVWIVGVAPGTEPDERLLTALMPDGSRRVFRATAVLAATGRRPNSAELGVDLAGVRLRVDGAVDADRTFRTACATVVAAGDVLGHARMGTTRAAREGELAVENALCGTRHTFDEGDVPYAILTSPQVAGVGMTERGARAAGFSVKTATVRLRQELPKATADRGLIKLVADAASHRVLGLHLLAANAAEVIHEGVWILKQRAAVADIRRTPHVYPSVSEAILRTADAYDAA